MSSEVMRAKVRKSPTCGTLRDSTGGDGRSSTPIGTAARVPSMTTGKKVVFFLSLTPCMYVWGLI